MTRVRALAAIVLVLALAVLVVPVEGAPGHPHPTHHPKPTPTIAATPTSVTATPTLPRPTPTSVTGGDDRLTCAGYPQPRVFVEAQTWWLQTPGKAGTDFGHVHLGACLPSEQTVKGTIHLDVRVIMHDSHGAAFSRIEPVAKTNGIELTLGSYTGCAGTTTDTGTVTCWQGLDVDTTRYDVDGRNELRLRAWANTPNGKLMHVSLNVMWRLANGKTSSDMSRLPFERGKGWYGGSGFDQVGYCEADVTSPVTNAVRSGTWSPGVRIVNHDASIGVTRSSARLDPDFHAVPPVQGAILFDQAGQHADAPLAIDTTKLANGTHRLVLRADCDDASGSTNSGVLVVTFTVANP